MRWVKRLFHPLIAFIGIQLIWGFLVFFWIYWFIGSHKAFRKLAEMYKPELKGFGIEWTVLVEGLALLLLVLAARRRGFLSHASLPCRLSLRRSLPAPRARVPYAGRRGP